MRAVGRRCFLKTSMGTAASFYAGRYSNLNADVQGEVHVCPKSLTPARHMFAFRLEELTSFSWDLRLTLTSLQGLVNRRQPRLFLIQDRYDELWLTWLRERGDIDQVEYLEVGQVFERFLPEVSSLFVTDPDLPASINVACMLASCRDGIVCTPATTRQYHLSHGAPPDSNKVGLDLRDFHWKKDVEAYRWVYRQLDQELSRQAIAYIDPYSIGLRDYLIQFKIPALWIAAPEDSGRNPQASPEEEYEFAREILMKWPTNIPCLGWPGNSPTRETGIGEWPGVRLTSQCGKFTLCSGFDGYSPPASNLSVHSGTYAKLNQSSPRVIELQREKIYISFSRSDGDGLNFQRHYYRKLFDEVNHNSPPIAWQIGPLGTDCQPDILDYYYKHARAADYFVNALTGVGYIWEDDYADNFPPEKQLSIWSEYLRLSSIYRERIDATVISTFAEMTSEHLQGVAGISGIKTVLANYGRTDATTSENLVTEVGTVTVFRSVNRPPDELTFTPAGRRDAEALTVEEIRRWTPKSRPAFLHVFLANWFTHMEMLENVTKNLGPDYAAVRPDQLTKLYQQAKKGV
jgi:hypothetical protein